MSKINSGSLFYVREVGNMGMLSKWDNNPPLACNGGGGHGNNIEMVRVRGTREHRQNGITIHLQLTLACEGGGGHGNGVEMVRMSGAALWRQMMTPLGVGRHGV